MLPPLPVPLLDPPSPALLHSLKSFAGIHLPSCLLQTCLLTVVPSTNLNPLKQVPVHVLQYELRWYLLDRVLYEEKAIQPRNNFRDYLQSMGILFASNFSVHGRLRKFTRWTCRKVNICMKWRLRLAVLSIKTSGHCLYRSIQMILISYP